MRDEVRKEAQVWRERAARWRKAGGVAMAQRCDIVCRNLTYAADEMREVEIRGLEPNIGEK